MTVGELDERMGAHEYTDWMQYFEWREWLRANPDQTL